MRADEIKPGDASVVASADTPFDYPACAWDARPGGFAGDPRAAAASAGQPNARRPPMLSSTGSKPRRSIHGHTLWALSQNYYGDPTRYPVIYEANRSQIHNPNLIYPGQVFVVPKFEPKP